MGAALNKQQRDDVDRWVDIAKARGADAALLMAAPREVGTIYLLGYVAEAYAKALVRALGKSPAKTHDILALLEDAGVRRQDLPVDIRTFAETRKVDLRYEVAVPGDYEATKKCAMDLARWLRRRLNRLT